MAGSVVYNEKRLLRYRDTKYVLQTAGVLGCGGGCASDYRHPDEIVVASKSVLRVRMSYDKGDGCLQISTSSLGLARKNRGSAVVYARPAAVCSREALARRGRSTLQVSTQIRQST